jgi:hypothetical protein
MAAKGKERTKYENPISVAQKIEGEPPRSTRNSQVGATIEAIVEQTSDGGWVQIDKAGRPASTVQSSLQSAGKRRGVALETRTSDGEVYVRVAPKGKGKS